MTPLCWSPARQAGWAGLVSFAGGDGCAAGWEGKARMRRASEGWRDGEYLIFK